MNTELALITPEEFLPLTQKSGIEKATEYANVFAPFMLQVKELGTKAAAINKNDPTTLDAKLAREIRLVLVKNRTATGSKKDESKAALIAEGNLIHSLHNVVVSSSQIIEAELSEIEKYAENKEKERIEALRLSRVEILSPYVDDANIFPLGTMTEDAFTSLVDGQRLAYEAKIEAQRLAEEAAIKAEAERIAEQKRIKAENERLKAEADRVAAEQAAERKRVADEAAKKEAEHKNKLAEIEAANKAARDKAAKEQAKRDEKAAAELKAKQAEADKLAAELKAKNDAYEAEQTAKRKAEADKAAAEKKAAKAPVKEKLSIAINALVLNLPESDITSDILSKFNGFKTWATQQINQL